jgi:hypothetical protein
VSTELPPNSRESPTLPAKSPLLVVLLQCLPLLFAGGCIASTFGPAGWYLEAPGNSILLAIGLFAFAWGLGYAYLGRTRRWVGTLPITVGLAIFAWWLNLVLLTGCIDLGTSFQCPQRVRIFDRPFALLTAVVVGVWVVAYARDALRLVTALNTGASEEQTGRIFRYLMFGCGAIAIAVTAFYFSPYCTQMWNSTR